MKGKYTGDKHPCAREVVLISPEGVSHQMKSYYQFCLNKKLSSGSICSVLKGRYKHHKGWTGYYV